MPAEVQELLPTICAEHQFAQSGQEFNGQSGVFYSDDDAAALLLGERTLHWMPAATQGLLPKICAEHRVPPSGQGLGDESDGFSCDDDAILLLGESLYDLESVSNDSDLDDLVNWTSTTVYRRGPTLL